MKPQNPEDTSSRHYISYKNTGIAWLLFDNYPRTLEMIPPAHWTLVLFIVHFAIARKEIPRFPGVPYGSDEGGLLSTDPRYSQSVLHVESSLLSSNASDLAAEACPVDTFQCASYPNCCYDGYKCCANDSCCPDNSFCYGYRKCCKNGSQTCGGKSCCVSGATCCSAGCCSPGYGCCGANNCHPPGTHCCSDNGYCPDGWACAAGGKCVFDNEPPDTDSTTVLTTKKTIQTTSSTTKTTTSAVLSLSSLSIPGFSTTASQTGSSPSSTTSSGAVPTITFAYAEGLTDYIVSNICLGMRKRGKTQTDVLTYNPTNQANRRQAAGCSSTRCNTPETGTSCDTYPFSSTSEGGSNAQVGCIPAWQNTDQGGYLASFFALQQLTTPGKLFGIAVTGVDCSLFQTVGPLLHSGKKRADTSGYNATVLKPYSIGAQDQNRVLLPLGDLDNGSYSVSANTGGQSSSVILVDADGDTLANQSGSSVAQTVQINFDGPATGLGAIIFTKSSGLNATYNLTNAPSTNDGAAVPQITLGTLSSLLGSVTLWSMVGFLAITWI